MKRSLLLLGALAAAGCGDPIADGKYKGEPLALLQGRIVGDAGTSAISHPFLGILWFDISGSYTAQAVTVLAPMQGGILSRDFSVEVWEPPPPGTIGNFYGSHVAIGVAVAVDDVNGDGRVEIDPMSGTIAPPDVAFGGGMRSWLIYVDDGGRDLCQPWLFGRPVEERGKLYVSNAFNSCESLFDIQPPGAPLEIDLFTPSSRLPETEPGGCQDAVDCDLDPDHPACVPWSLYETCIETRCTRLAVAQQQCAYDQCPDGGDACVMDRCAREVSMLQICMSVTCSYENLCSD